MPQGITYNPCPEGCGFVILKDIIFEPLATLNKMVLSKFRLDVFAEMVGVGGGLVALQSFWTIKKATLASSISNRMSLFRSFYDNKWPSQNSYQIQFWKTRGACGGRISTLRSLWILKRALELLITNPMSPLPKFLRSPFLYKPYMPGAKLTTLALRAMGGLLSSKT